MFTLHCRLDVEAPRRYISGCVYEGIFQIVLTEKGRLPSQCEMGLVDWIKKKKGERKPSTSMRLSLLSECVCAGRSAAAHSHCGTIPIVMDCVPSNYAPKQKSPQVAFARCSFHSKKKSNEYSISFGQTLGLPIN